MFWFDSVEERELFIKDNLLSIKKCKHEWMPYKWLSINKYDEVRTDDKVTGRLLIKVICKHCLIKKDV